MGDSDIGHGRFWIGAGRPAPMYVESHEQTGSAAAPRAPVVLVHGGGGQGLDWLSTPDGRPGWALALADRGHPVFVIDRPGHGRGAAWADGLGEMGPAPTLELLTWLFVSPPGSHPTAELHTQWPGGEDALRVALAQSRAMPTDLAVAHGLERDAGAQLLELTGPAIVMTHSAGAPMGWLMAAERPELVRALVALEPFGPPYRPADGGLPGLPDGLTAVALGDLAGVSILQVSAEASPLRHFDAEVRDHLAGAGARVELMQLADHGVHGNGHGMIFEANHLEVLEAVVGELERFAPSALD
jgi:pimeloyl-ACP methyl ester carboxylesterase